MKPMLPAERELPARRHAALRDALVATVEGDTAPRWRRPVAVAAAAASVMAVGAGLTVWQLTDDGRQGPQRIEPAQPTIPGLSDEERAEIERRCTDLANRSAKADMSGRSGPPVPKDGSYVLYNTAVEADGDRVSLLYDLDENVGVSCTIHPTPPEKRTGDWQVRDTEGSVLDWPIRWLPGGMAWEDGGTAGGRVDAGVVRVTVSRGGKTIEVTPINGTFLTVAELPPGMDESHPTVRAYDADGNVVADNKAKDGPSCWVDPDGKVVGGVSLTSATPNSPGECEPARPWPPATK